MLATTFGEALKMHSSMCATVKAVAQHAARFGVKPRRVKQVDLADICPNPAISHEKALLLDPLPPVLTVSESKHVAYKVNQYIKANPDRQFDEDDWQALYFAFIPQANMDRYHAAVLAQEKQARELDKDYNKLVEELEAGEHVS